MNHYNHTIKASTYSISITNLLYFMYFSMLTHWTTHNIKTTDNMIVQSITNIIIVIILYK